MTQKTGMRPNTCLKEVRRALGDDGQQQRCIQTLRKQGYRFVAEVSLKSKDDILVENSTTDTLTNSILGREYKNVTILICTISEMDELATGLGDEKTHQMMQIVLSHARKIVTKFDGFLAQLLGDGFMALFGARRAYEDHALRAIMAVEELKTALHRCGALKTVLHVPLSISTGIHTGSVVIGRLELDPDKIYTAAGVTTRYAERLHKVVPPDTVLISDTTYRLVAQKTHVELFMVPTEASEILTAAKIFQLLKVDRQNFLSQRKLSHFVGRQHELGALERLLVLACSRQGQIITIVGDPGIGKTRLLEEFIASMDLDGVVRKQAACVSFGYNLSYFPLRGLLRDICGISESDSQKLVDKKLNLALADTQLESSLKLPYLRRLMNLSSDKDQLEGISAQTIQERMFNALAQLIVGYSRFKPLIITVEDVQWIDSASVMFLEFLADKIVGAAVMLITTHRPGYSATWVNKSYASQLSLQALSRQSCCEIVNRYINATPGADQLQQSILSRADGNPFFLEEIAQAVCYDQAKMKKGDDSLGLDVPNAVQDVLAARIDQLPEKVKKLLQISSTLGRKFEREDLCILLDEIGDLDMQLEILQRYEFLYQTFSESKPYYVFKHALTQEVAYTSLLVTDRQQLHTLMANALETKDSRHDGDVLERLAYHFGRGHDAVKAITYLNLLGEKAARDYAHHEAITAYSLALSHVPNLAQDMQLIKRLDILLRQAFSLSVLGRIREVVDLLQPEYEYISQLDIPELVSRYHFRFGLALLYSGKIESALHSAETALQIAEKSENKELIGQTKYLCGVAHLMNSQFRLGLINSVDAVTYLQHSNEGHWLGLANWVAGYNSTYLGEYTNALAFFQATAAIGDATSDPRLCSFAQSYAGWVYAIQGNTERAIELCLEGLSLAPDAIAKLACLMHLGFAYLEHEKVSDAIRVFEQLTGEFAEFKEKLPDRLSRFAAYYASALYANKQNKKANTVALQGLADSQGIDNSYGMALNQKVLGQLALADGKLDQALSYLQQAFAIFTDSEVRYDIGRTLLVLAELADAQGEQPQRQNYLRQASDIFQQLDVAKYSQLC